MAEEVSLVKAVQKAGKANFIYLPLSWLKRVGMPKALEMKEEDSKLILSAEKFVRRPVEKTIKIDQYEFELVNRIIQWAYYSGFDKFTLELPKKLSSAEILKHREILEEKKGFTIDLLNISENKISFYVTQGFSDPRIVFRNFLDKLLLFFRATSIKEKEHILKKHWIDIMRSRHLLRRLYLTSVQSPALLKEYGLNALEIYSFENMAQHLVWTRAFIGLFGSITKEDFEKLKRCVDIVAAFVDKQDYKYLAEFERLKNSIKRPELEEELRRVERYLLSLWLARL
jgi:hypothetical protein